MGAPFEFAKGEGPVVHEPIRDRAGIEKLRVIDAEEGLPHVLEAIRMIRAELDGKTPLIGFAGAPFTLASYLIEGGKSSQYAITKSLMYGEPELWHSLMEKLSEVVRRYLHAQIRAGAQAVQLFDSWVGQLSPTDYKTYIFPHVSGILQDVMTAGVPVIHFGTGTATLLDLQRQAGGSVIGVDWRTPLGSAWETLAPHVAVQGNLDPHTLCAPWPVLEAHMQEVLDAVGGRDGHIFNLGHGIMPHTPPEMVTRAVEWVHEHSTR
jgi:uroporphyrinogen decarboxylase